MKPIQLNIVKKFATWTKLYWKEDFANDENVAQVLQEWIKQMQIDLKQYSWNGLLDTLQNKYNSYKKTRKQTACSREGLLSCGNLKEIQPS
ncbi:hypothetical protein RFI_04554 [Reticulomyxa filosa]|uniref:Uncharacterized protein n=1 Tax=Reticulomyxa filosa TaxID=46433 RepID=X6P1Y9_RETFI|nr:hypothetical protein RFI_04554 [Reticulomyxa filosa]|eukprot:ETO32560.1 hypothetical protein RFI_04554 [Reticulomyxa filosa]